MNTLFAWFSRLNFTKTLLDMADEIAGRCQSEVCQHVWSRGRLMPLAEARGYVRVRASRVIRREVEAALSRQNHWQRQRREQLVELTLQRVVARTVAELSRAEIPDRSRRHAA